MRRLSIEILSRSGALVRTLAVAALVVSLAACSSGGTSSESTSPTAPAASTSNEPAGSTTQSAEAFTSARHGYSLEVPAGWAVTEYDGTWTDLDQFSPGAEVPGEDVVAPPGMSAFLVANSMAIPGGMEPAEWLAEFDALVEGGLGDVCPGTVSDGVVSGEPATIVEQPCEGSIVIGRSLTHGSRGYYFTSRYAEDDETAKATTEQLVASIQFTDG